MKYKSIAVEVDAYQIVKIGEPDEIGGVELTLADNVFSSTYASPALLQKISPIIGDYYILRDEGLSDVIIAQQVFVKRYEPRGEAKE